MTKLERLQRRFDLFTNTDFGKMVRCGLPLENSEEKKCIAELKNCSRYVKLQYLQDSKYLCLVGTEHDVPGFFALINFSLNHAKRIDSAKMLFELGVDPDVILKSAFDFLERQDSYFKELFYVAHDSKIQAKTMLQMSKFEAPLDKLERIRDFLEGLPSGTYLTMDWRTRNGDDTATVDKIHHAAMNFLNMSCDGLLLIGNAREKIGNVLSWNGRFNSRIDTTFATTEDFDLNKFIEKVGFGIDEIKRAKNRS